MCGTCSSFQTDSANHGTVSTQAGIANLKVNSKVTHTEDSNVSGRVRWQEKYYKTIKSCSRFWEEDPNIMFAPMHRSDWTAALLLVLWWRPSKGLPGINESPILFISRPTFRKADEVQSSQSLSLKEDNSVVMATAQLTLSCMKRHKLNLLQLDFY